VRDTSASAGRHDLPPSTVRRGPAVGTTASSTEISTAASLATILERGNEGSSAVTEVTNTGGVGGSLGGISNTTSVPTTTNNNNSSSGGVAGVAGIPNSGGGAGGRAPSPTLGQIVGALPLPDAYVTALAAWKAFVTRPRSRSPTPEAPRLLEVSWEEPELPMMGAEADPLAGSPPPPLPPPPSGRVLRSLVSVRPPIIPPIRLREDHSQLAPALAEAFTGLINTLVENPRRVWTAPARQSLRGDSARSIITTVGDNGKSARGGLRSSTTFAPALPIVTVSSGGDSSSSHGIEFVDVAEGAPRKRKAKKKYPCTSQLKRRKGAPKQTPLHSIPRVRRRKSAPLPPERPTRGSGRLAPPPTSPPPSPTPPPPPPGSPLPSTSRARYVTHSSSSDDFPLPPGFVLGTFGYEPRQIEGQDSSEDWECNYPGGKWDNGEPGEEEPWEGESDLPSLSSSSECTADELEEELEGAPEDVDYILEDAIEFSTEEFERALKREPSP
jgi:hypothetical protein